MITVLTGGTGGAKFVDGLRHIVAPEELTIIVNTGDDMQWWGLHISPDIDSIIYVLAGKLSQERGWGVERDTFLCLKEMREMGEPVWFSVGDRDLAMHLLRTKLLADGKTLTEATAELATRLGIAVRVLPMTDSPVETRVLTADGELSFEEYFVQRRYQDEVREVRFAGASRAIPAPGVLQAIRSSELVVLAPSNPVTSIGPILAVPGIREAMRETGAQIAAVSPVVGNAAVTGPAGALLASQGFAVSIAGVADFYRDFLDLLVADTQDAAAAEDLEKRAARRDDATAQSRNFGVRFHCTSTIMRRKEDRTALATEVLEACRHSTEISLRSERA
jgi:LPPG:FO 2-phospho-L-lactate transferase